MMYYDQIWRKGKEMGFVREGKGLGVLMSSLHSGMGLAFAFQSFFIIFFFYLVKISPGPIPSKKGSSCCRCY